MSLGFDIGNYMYSIDELNDYDKNKCRDIVSLAIKRKHSIQQ